MTLKKSKNGFSFDNLPVLIVRIIDVNIKIKIAAKIHMIINSGKAKFDLGRFGFLVIHSSNIRGATITKPTNAGMAKFRFLKLPDITRLH